MSEFKTKRVKLSDWEMLVLEEMMQSPPPHIDAWSFAKLKQKITNAKNVTITISTGERK